MALFITEDEGKVLGKKQVKVPDKIVDKLKLNRNLFAGYSKAKGYKRINSIIDDDYNKRSNKKDKIHNGDKTVSFSDLKRIDFDLRHTAPNKNNLDYVLQAPLKQWANDELKKLRTSVKKVKSVPPVPKLEKDTVEEPKLQKDIKMGNATVRLTESLDDGEHPFYDYLEEYGAYYVLEDFFDNPNGKQNWGTLINPEMYAKALREFTKYGKLIHFPTKYVYQWMGIILKNTAILCANTDLAGHSQSFPIDDVVDIAEYRFGINLEPSYEACSEWLDEQGLYDWMSMPDGSDAWSDYGIDPLMKIIKEYSEDLPPEKVLVLVNRALDVYHQRGDMASIFVQGGSKALSKIAEETRKGTKKIIIGENKLLLLKEYHDQLV